MNFAFPLIVSLSTATTRPEKIMSACSISSSKVEILTQLQAEADRVGVAKSRSEGIKAMRRMRDSNRFMIVSLIH